MKKRILALFLVLALAICTFPAAAFADYDQQQPVQVSAVSTPAQYLQFKDHNGSAYYVYSGTVISQGSSHTGYVLVIQEVLDRLYHKTGNANFNPNGVDGVFGNGTRLAVVCFQVAYIGASGADGVVGPTTWLYLHDKWENTLNSPALIHVVQ